MVKCLEIEDGRLQCGRCGYKWTPRRSNPASCPYCKRRFKRETQESRLQKLREVQHDSQYFYCGLCGNEMKKWFQIDGNRVCEKCLVELVEERINR